MNETPLRQRLGLEQSANLPSDINEPERDGRWEQLPGEPEPVAQQRPRVRGVVRELLETAIFILLVFFIVRGIVQNFKIEGSSMEPTMHNSQFILVNKLVYFHFDLNAPLRLLPGQENIPQRIVYPFHQPQRGDIIVFEYPRDVSKDYIKRVIALPGETIEFRDQQVYVNGELLDEPYLEGAPSYCYSGEPCNGQPYVIPPGTVFVMGDNRTNSSDSRDWGALPFDRVIGQAWVIYYPFTDWGVVEHFTYAADGP
jgi:signal peptidase I